MQDEPYGSIGALAESHLKNFQGYSELYRDILQWADRIKRIVSIYNLHEPVTLPVGFAQLMNLISRSFINSLILEMLPMHDHACAIRRIGIDAFRQIAVMHLNPKENVEIWVQYAKECQNGKPSEQTKSNYNKVFSGQFPKYDFSGFVLPKITEYLKKQWSKLSLYGSHPGFASTLFSSKFRPDRVIEFYFYDHGQLISDQTGLCMIVNIDTFFAIAHSLPRICEQHDQKCRESSIRVSEMYSEWATFKLSKEKMWKVLSDKTPLVDQ